MSNQHAGLIQVPVEQPTNPLSPTGTWTIDPSDSSVSLAWRKHRLWTITARLHCFGFIHLDPLPPVGVIQFQQPSGLPVLTMALDPASVDTHDADLAARLPSPKVLDVQRHRWWTLHSQSLEVLPTGTWRVMAAVTANGIAGRVELRFELDPKASTADWLVLRGHGVLDRRAFGIGNPASIFAPQIRLDFFVRGRRVAGPRTHSERNGEVDAQPTCRAEPAAGRPTQRRTT